MGNFKLEENIWYAKPVTSPQEEQREEFSEDDNEFLDALEIGEYARVWKKDLKHGNWMEWDEDGMAQKVEVFNKGELVEVISIQNENPRP